MEKLIIEKTKATPFIEFDGETSILTIKGQSYPENPFKFYEPVIKWIDEFFSWSNSDKEIVFEIKMPYINTSSSKCIMMMLERLESAKESGKNIKVNWYYEEDNDSELECAEDFKDFVDLSFDIIPVSGDLE